MTKKELKIIEILKDRNIYLEKNNTVLKAENIILMHKVASLQEELFIAEMGHLRNNIGDNTLENLKKW